MAIELSTVAAGLPMAASFAMAGGFVAHREARRRSSLNAAMHELRRPLQALCLFPPSASDANDHLEATLDMAVAAVERLDEEINGRQVRAEMMRLSMRSLVEAAVERWRPALAGAGRPLRLSWTGNEAIVEGDRVALSQAVDNLISNALEHGSGTIAVRVDAGDRLLRLAVRDQGRREVGAAARGIPSFRRGRRRARGRHGHGLGIVRGAAARHGGTFRLVRSASGSEARLVLPLAGTTR